MKTEESATVLAESMIEIGKMCNKKITSVITNMDVPLGNCIGNALEVKEAIEVLKGKGNKNLKQVCVVLASQMLVLCKGYSEEKAEALVNEVLQNDVALNKFKEWISEQGGDTSFIENPNGFHPAKYKEEVVAETDGSIEYINAEELGKAAVVIGAGREKKTDNIDFSAGIELNKNVGDFVKKGEKTATVYSSTVSNLFDVGKIVNNNIIIKNKKPEKQKLIYKIIK